MKRTRRRTVLSVIIMLVMGLALSLGACGSGDTGDKSSSTAEVKFTTYTDKTYGFSFAYPEDWKLQEGTAFDISAGSNAKAGVGVFDTEGTKVGDRYIDMMLVAVYELRVTIDESMMPDVKTELEGLLGQLQSQDASIKMQGDLTQTTVSGLPGFMATYTFNQDGEPATTTLYFLFDGAIEYQLSVQAATKVWPDYKPLFDSMVASFKPGAAK